MAKMLDNCAREVMDTIPVIMRAIRSEMRRGRGTELSIPQFRALGFVQRNPNSSLGDLAEHLGLTPPSTSKMIDGLVNQGLVVRQQDGADRRRITLGLTKSGRSIVESARTRAQANLAGILGRLDTRQLTTIHEAMRLLQPLFSPQPRVQPGESNP